MHFKSIEANWNVNEDGKINLNYGFIVNIIRYETGEVILKSQNNIVEKIEDDCEVNKEIERYIQLKKMQQELPALMMIEVNIQLDIVNTDAGKRMVVPNVMVYDVVSFTNELKSPARLFHQPQEKLDETVSVSYKV